MADPKDEARIIADSITIEGWDDLMQQMKAVFGDIGNASGADLLTSLGFQGGDPTFAAVAESTLEDAAKRAAELIGKRVRPDGTVIDNPNPEWAISDSTRDMLFDTINDALERGLSAGAIRNEIVDSYGFSARRALMIARTERNFSQQRGALTAARSSGVVKGKQNVLASEHPDDLDDECVEAEDVGIIPIDEPFPDGSDGPPFHPNCIVGDSLVSPIGRIAARFKRWYEGEILKIVFADKTELIITPNHPVLTPSGWIAARELGQGLKVFQCESERAPALIHPDHQYIPTRIEEISRTALMAKGVTTRRMPVTAEAFHGDVGGYCEIDIVRSSGLLAAKYKARRIQGLGQSLFPVAHLRRLILAKLGALPQMFGGEFATADRPMRSGREFLALFGRRGLVPFIRGLAHTTNAQPQTLKVVSQREAMNAKFLGQIDARLAAFIASMQILNLFIGKASLRGRLPFAFTTGQHQRFGARPQSKPFDLERPMDSTAADAIGYVQLRRRLSGLVSLKNLAHLSVSQFKGHVYNLNTSAQAYLASGVVVHNCSCTLEFTTDEPPESDEEEEDAA